MRTLFRSTLCILFLLPALQGQQPAEFYNVKYDTSADPFVQLATAKVEATQEHKNILLDVGGEWCKWCHRLDSLFRSNSDLAAFVDEHFVPIKINMSLDHENKKFLSQYPPIEGYPHLFVLDRRGELLHSQDTGALEQGKGYDKEKVLAFLKKWTAKK